MNAVRSIHEIAAGDDRHDCPSPIEHGTAAGPRRDAKPDFQIIASYIADDVHRQPTARPRGIGRDERETKRRDR